MARPAVESMENALSTIHAFVNQDTLGTAAKTCVSIQCFAKKD